MARYIDADKLTEELKLLEMFITGMQCGKTQLTEAVAEYKKSALRLIDEQQTADVVPKSEVERLTVELDAMRGAANTYKMHYENARKEIERLKYNTGVAFNHYFDGRKEVAREIFEELLKEASLRFDGFRNTIIFPLDYYNELKKKYTERKGR